MSSSTEICNMALSHIGVGREIASFDEKSQEAAACRRFYDLAREATLRDFPWTFAKRFATLALVQTKPTLEWGFSYAMPSGCASLTRIVSGNRNDTLSTRIVYEVAADEKQRLILTDQPNAQAQYTANVTNAALFPADFVMALTYRLASLLAPRLAGGDPYKLGQACFTMYLNAISSAKSSTMNEEQLEQNPDSEYTLARS